MIRVEPTTSTVTSRAYPAEYAAYRRIRWGAVIAGTLIALVITVMLNLLGIGIGMASINPTTEQNPFAGIGTGAIIWYVIATLIALFAGGYVAGKMSGFPKKSNAALHGLLSWALFTIISLYLFTTAVGRVVSGVGSAISSVTSGVGNAVAAAVPNDINLDGLKQELNLGSVTLSDIRNEAYQLLEDTDKAALDPDNLERDANQIQNSAERNANQAENSPFTAGRQVNDVLDRIQSKGSNVMEAADKEALVNVLMERSNLSRAEANAKVDAWGNQLEQAQAQLKQTLQQAGETAEEVGGDVADALATAAILGFVALLLGALAGYFGGATGRQADLAVGTTGPAVSGVEVDA